MSSTSKRGSKGEEGLYIKVRIMCSPAEKGKRPSAIVCAQRLSFNRPEGMWPNIRDLWGFARNSRE
jgi:hypothetical protein